MISRVMVKSLSWVKAFLRSPITYRDDEGIKFPVAIISIRDISDDCTTLNFQRRVWPDQIDEILALHFEDSEFDINGPDEPGKFKQYQAREIREFVKRIHSSEKTYTLIVHCVAGVCRSGAVGEVVSDFVGIKYDDFKRENPQILPNNSVRVRLRRTMEE